MNGYVDRDLGTRAPTKQANSSYLIDRKSILEYVGLGWNPQLVAGQRRNSRGWCLERRDGNPLDDWDRVPLLVRLLAAAKRRCEAGSCHGDGLIVRGRGIGRSAIHPRFPQVTFVRVTRRSFTLKRMCRIRQTQWSRRRARTPVDEIRFLNGNGKPKLGLLRHVAVPFPFVT